MGHPHTSHVSIVIRQYCTQCQYLGCMSKIFIYAVVLQKIRTPLLPDNSVHSREVSLGERDFQTPSQHMVCVLFANDIDRMSSCYTDDVLLLHRGCPIAIQRMSSCYTEDVLLLYRGCPIAIQRMSYCYTEDVLLLYRGCPIAIQRMSYCYIEDVLLLYIENVILLYKGCPAIRGCPLAIDIIEGISFLECSIPCTMIPPLKQMQ